MNRNIFALSIIAFKRIYLFILSKYFNFDPWHSKVFYENSGYIKNIVAICDELQTETIIELGCGIGEQLIHIHINKRIGIDIDKNVISAAKFLNAKKALFYQCNLLINTEYEHMLKTIPPEYKEKSSTFIMVNWIHAIELPVIKKMLGIIRTNFNVQYIIVDLIHPENKAYKYKYTVDDFSDIGQVKLLKKADDNIRSILVLSVINY